MISNECKFYCKRCNPEPVDSEWTVRYNTTNRPYTTVIIILTVTTTNQPAVVRIQLNIVACPTYPEQFIRDNVVAAFVLLSVVIVTLPFVIESVWTLFSVHPVYTVYICIRSRSLVLDKSFWVARV